MPPSDHGLAALSRARDGVRRGRNDMLHAMPDAPANLRARAVLVATVLATVAALLASSWSSWRGVRAAQDALVTAQAEAALRAVHEALRLAPGPLEDADLTSLLESQRASGLRYVALLHDDGSVASSAGESLAPATEERARGGLSIRRIGDRVRALAARPRPPGWAPRDPPFPDDRPPRPPGPPGIAVEFVPQLASDLESRARLTLALGALSAAMLLAGAVLTTRLLRQSAQAQRELAEQRRLADLGGMSAVIAHELRNPLASLKGHAQLLAEKLPEGDASRKAARIVDEARRLELLATSLLDFVRSGRIERQATDPGALLREAAGEAAEGRVAFDLSSCPASWPLDAMRVRQALTNLIVNAAQASPDGARVDASARADGTRLVYAIADRGPGLPAGKEDRVFEPFFTTRASGTGLGLAVTRRIAELHGGVVRARARPGGGAMFELILPREG